MSVEFYDPRKEPKCLVCGHPEVDRAHIKTKGSGGDEDPSNMMQLCRTHHVEQHKIGIVTFTLKYWSVRKYLFANGWEIVSQDRRHRLMKAPKYE